MTILETPLSGDLKQKKDGTSYKYEKWKKWKYLKRIQKNVKKKVETIWREERWRDKSWDELGSSRDSTQPQGGVINQTFREKHLRFIHILIQIYS